jgi:hypothetical protein
MPWLKRFSRALNGKDPFLVVLSVFIVHVIPSRS